MNKDSKDSGELHHKNLDSINKSLENFAKMSPKEGYVKAIKKRYFKPKTNWTMLGVLVALAGLLAMALINFS